MGDMTYCIGFDCGNSSIRTVLGSFDGSHIKTEVVSQVSNKAIRSVSYDYWDILRIFQEMQYGFKKALDAVDRVSSFGISTWGIDFGFIGRSGELLANPLCYRNPLGQAGLDSRSSQELEKLFFDTGILNHPMNSLYQLLGIKESLPEYLQCADRLLLIPDLLNYLFTGEKNSESSIASTTQLLDMRTKDYSDIVLSMAGLRRDMFSPMVDHGTIRGYLREDIAAKLGIGRIPAISVPSHDTAAAVVAVPSLEEDFAFISSGTWSLIGTELQGPIINDSVFREGFSNEGGVHKSITLLRNSAGMHILQNIKRELEFSDSRDYTWEEIVAMSSPSMHDPNLVVFDPNVDLLYNPDSMIRALKTLTGERLIGRLLASSYKSLAVSYAKTIEQLERITGKTYPVIHIIGGGSRNDHLNQMTADLSGKKVVAGPEEATSLGTIAVQLLYLHPGLRIADIRQIIRDSVNLHTYTPGNKGG